MPPRGEQTSSNSRLYTITEVAEVLGINRATAYRLAREDRLPAPVIRLGRQFRVVKAPIDAVVAGRQEGAEPAPAPPHMVPPEDAPADPVAVISRAVLAHAEAIEGGRASGGVATLSFKRSPTPG